MAAVYADTSNCGHGWDAFGAWPNWNHFPVPEYSIDLVSEAFSASAAAASVPAG